ncbi:DNA polymerase III subunit delta' [Vibrio sp.]|uniref:DNA polymerase III subunit delta' n=1 Tax=Vibrio sp. TaxID=678 RepID=UPI003D136321
MSELYPWLTTTWRCWRDNLVSNRVANVLLLTAEPGLGVEQLTEQFSLALMCSHQSDQACGFCHSCQLMASHNHPDYHLVQPEKEGKTISVDQIRQCNRWAQESSQLSGKRLIIIQPAQMMTESAANALLKTLEDPPAQCIFILLAERSSQLLPTIVSRCQHWHVAPPMVESAIEWLSEQCGKACPDYVVSLANNAPVLAKQLFEQGQVASYQEIESKLLGCLNGDSLVMLDLAAQLAKEPGIRLGWLWQLLADAQKCHFGIASLGQLPAAKSLAEMLDYDRLYQASEQLAQLQHQLTQYSGLNAELLITDWLISIKEETCL